MSEPNKVDLPEEIVNFMAMDSEAMEAAASDLEADEKTRLFDATRTAVSLALEVSRLEDLKHFEKLKEGVPIVSSAKDRDFNRVLEILGIGGQSEQFTKLTSILQAN